MKQTEIQPHDYDDFIGNPDLDMQDGWSPNEGLALSKAQELIDQIFPLEDPVEYQPTPDQVMQDGLQIVSKEEQDRDSVDAQANILGRDFSRPIGNIKIGDKQETLKRNLRKEIVSGYDNATGTIMFEPRKQSHVDHTILPELDAEEAVVIYSAEDQGTHSWSWVNKQRTSCKHLPRRNEENPLPENVDELPEIPF